MKISIDENLCVGCRACVGACPECFGFNEEKNVAEVKNPAGCGKCEIDDGICPVGAIKIEE